MIDIAKPAPSADGRGLLEGKLSSDPSDNPSPNLAQVDPALELLFERCCTLADRVAAGELPFLEAIDFAWSAAEFAGTVDRVGPDPVQAVLAQAFMGVPR